MSKKFTTSAKARTAIDFEIDEVPFKFTPPKSAAMIMPVLDGGGDDMSFIRAGLDWIKEGLEDDKYALLVNRLKDPKDDYDIEEFQDLIEWLVEMAAADRPIL